MSDQDALKHLVFQTEVMGEWRQNCTCGWRSTRKHIETAIKSIGRHLDSVRRTP